MVQIIGEHFAGHGDGGQFLTDEADLAAERKGHLPALHDKPRPLIGLAYEQQFAGDVAGGQRINKLLVGRLAIGGQEHRVGGAGFADAQQSGAGIEIVVDALTVADGRRAGLVREHHIGDAGDPL